MHYCKGFDKKGVLPHEYILPCHSAILPAPHFRQVANGVGRQCWVLLSRLKLGIAWRCPNLPNGLQENRVPCFVMHHALILYITAREWEGGGGGGKANSTPTKRWDGKSFSQAEWDVGHTIY